jgi:hypothetical protein
MQMPNALARAVAPRAFGVHLVHPGQVYRGASALIDASRLRRQARKPSRGKLPSPPVDHHGRVCPDSDIRCAEPKPAALSKIGGPEYISHCDALRHPCFQQFDLNPATMTLAGKSLFEFVVVLPRCPLALGSCSSEAQFGFFQIGHANTFMSFAAVTRSRNAMHSVPRSAPLICSHYMPLPAYAPGRLPDARRHSRKIHKSKVPSFSP